MTQFRNLIASAAALTLPPASPFTPLRPPPPRRPPRP
jgi:hypothetical protein